MSITIQIVVAVLASTGIWNFIDHALDRREKKKAATKECSQKKIDDKIDEILTEVSEIKEDLTLTKNLSKSQARAALNEWSEKFIDYGFIPKNYYVAYKTLGDDYLEAGGNSEVGEKFNYIIENLDVR